MRGERKEEEMGDDEKLNRSEQLSQLFSLGISTSHYCKSTKNKKRLRDRS
jgi:hypothetical protein